VSGLNYRVAGPDEALARAVISARSARLAGIPDVLAASRGDLGLRAWRSQVLGSACADSDVAAQWLREDPGNPDARLLYARCTVAQALRAADHGDRKQAKGLAEIARRACWTAVEAAAGDPTPFAAMLALAPLNVLPETVRISGPEGLEDLLGPWNLFAEIRKLDPLHREGHLRFLASLCSRNGGSDAQMMAFAQHVALSTPFDSDPQLLMLVALVEHFKSKIAAAPRVSDPAEQARQEQALLHSRNGQWRTEMALRVSLDMYEDWFPKALHRFTPVIDFSYLAHALWAGDRTREASDVLRAMGLYASALPWSLYGQREQVLARVRAECHAGPPSPGWVRGP
jgi:hypothetical protein